MTQVKNYFENALSEVDTLPPVSTVLHKILELTDGDENPREELIRCVSLDQAIAAKVLQIINSAYYGIRQEVSSLEVAVALLGDKKVREIAIMCSTSGVLRGGIRGYGIPSDQFWLHSVTTGFAARLIAGRFAPERRETAFVAGLLHDIGKLVIDRLIEEPHREMLLELAGNLSPDYHSKEIELFGFDHCTIGYFVAQRWNFPVELVSAIAFHHYPDYEVEHRDMVRVVCFADALAHLHSMGVHDPSMVAALEEKGRIPFDLSYHEVEEFFSRLKAEVGDAQAFLGM